ncbi:MAG: hypothetical protein A2W25_15770 [candidate division Zixibacteria bacterium RBG_16_53_22]|nr:MAG: hypothetical protein A2W25_15770 [candidate division Zixibacteria bacterium RBG_16_53_22]
MRYVLAIDLGTKRVGLAIADPVHRIATGLGVVEYKGLQKFIEDLKKIVDDENVRLAVVGLPLNMDGSEGVKARQARKIAGIIEEKLEIDVELIDERLTTEEAVRRLHAAEGKVGKSRAKLNMMAAIIILQDYLDSLPPRSLS